MGSLEGIALLHPQTVCGKDLTVLRCLGVSYFIGVEFSRAVKKETFNIYRSLKLRGVQLVRLGLDSVVALVIADILPRGTRSATLIPVGEAIAWLEEETKKKARLAATSQIEEGEYASDTGASRSAEESEWDVFHSTTETVQSDAEDGTPAWAILASLKRDTPWWLN